MTPRMILFPTDFSGGCDRPRDRALRLARLWDATLVLVHVMPEPDPTLLAEERGTMAAQAEKRLGAEVQGQPVTFTTRVAFGDVAEEIMEIADETGAELIVTGISRRDDLGAFIIGTTVERLVRRADVPVLAVKRPVQRDYDRMMIATDFSVGSEEALYAGLAIFPEAETTILHAYQVRLEALRGREGPAAELQAEIAYELDCFLEGLQVTENVRERFQINVDYGDLLTVARTHAEATGTELAVIGTHGRSGFVAAVLGSQARSLLAGLDCDLLLVHGRPKP